MAAEAFELYLESILADGERLPISEDNVPGTIREPVTVTLPAVMDADERAPAELERPRSGLGRDPPHRRHAEVAGARARAFRRGGHANGRRRDQADAP